MFFKCLVCGEHKSGLEVGKITVFPLQTPPRQEITCSDCLDGKQVTNEQELITDRRQYGRE